GIPESNRVLWLHLVVTATGALVVFALTNLSRSAVGRAIRATAEDEVAAAAMGVPVVRVRTMMFGVAAAISGLAGGLLALEIRAVSTSQFTVPFSLMLYAAIVFGGADRLLGAFLGALLVVVMPWLQVEMGWKISPDMLYGALLLAGVAALPLGAAPWLADRARRLVAVVEAPPGDRDYTVPRRRPAAGPVAALDAGDQRADEGDSPVEVIPL
ncbi:MAG: branched-chain amino acid ABC transporter permease, partial [Acidimicrobiia bacterium]|nr:branched-chain amino acid ABC transporter permease [Acidimicrobiia bacterium]